MVSPNVSQESPLLESQASLNNFIDMHMRHNFVVNEKLTLKSESTQFELSQVNPDLG